MINLEKIEKTLKYKFNNNKNLETALTHSSFSADNYEKLEFLGDSILSFIVSDYLYDNFNLKSGELSKLRAKIVSTDSLFDAIQKLNLQRHLILGKSMKDRPISKKIIADTFESVLGAVFIDGGIEKAQEFVFNHLIKSKNNIEKLFGIKDFKTELQEYCQKLAQTFEYKLINKKGPDNRPMFEISLIVNDKPICSKSNLSIQSAEMECAKFYLLNINKF